MGWVSDAVRHPRRLFLRRVMFQVHLWAGVLLSLYLVLIALSGSVLVFKDELVRWSLPAALRSLDASHEVTPAEVMRRFAAEVPGGSVAQMQVPTDVLPAYLLTGKDGAGRPGRWFAARGSGVLVPAPRTWVDAVRDLHYYLLLPPAYGMQVNAVGGAVLLMLAASGLVLWWPGLKIWTRGLRVNLHASWRRINYDLHSAIGFWTLFLVSWWALSGVYFGFYKQVVAVVGVVSPVVGMQSPQPMPLPPARTHVATLRDVLQAAEESAPHARLWSVSDPSLKGPEAYVLLDRETPGDFSHRDIVRVRTADARVESVWHYGERHTLSDWFLWAMHPLHFGTVWGFGVKLLWALVGLLLAVLTVTGVLMYWNRWLCKRYRALRPEAPAATGCGAPDCHCQPCRLHPGRTSPVARDPAAHVR